MSPEEFARNTQMCRARARAAADVETRREWLTLASQWTTLAREWLCSENDKGHEVYNFVRRSVANNN